HHQQVLQAIRNRRIDVIADALGVGPLDRQPFGRGAILRVGDLGEWDDLGENLDLFLDDRPAAEEHVDDLLEVEQPEWQVETGRVHDVGALAKATPYSL